MDLQLDNKVALVVGASRGIGASIADALAAEGCRLMLCARGEDALQETAQALRQAHGVDVLAHPADVTDPASASALVAQAERHFGRLDVLVGNAGGNRRKPFADTTDEDWGALVELNVLAHLRVARAALPLLGKQGGSILFVASIFGREAGGVGLSIYNATKSALISAAKIMSLELAPQGVRVNTLAPGSIRFPGSSWDKRVAADPEGMARFVAENLPIGRFGTAEEVARVAAFLVSPAASLVTGACVNADGGQSRSLI